MTSYERVRNTLDGKPVDRAPFDISAEEVVWRRLEERLGAVSPQAVMDILDIDRRSVGPRYIGPPLRHFEDGSYEIIVSGGPVMKPLPTGNGFAESIVFFPWADVGAPEDLEGRWGWNGKKEW